MFCEQNLVTGHVLKFFKKRLKKYTFYPMSYLRAKSVKSFWYWAQSFNVDLWTFPLIVLQWIYLKSIQKENHYFLIKFLGNVKYQNSNCLQNHWVFNDWFCVFFISIYCSTFNWFECSILYSFWHYSQKLKSDIVCRILVACTVRSKLKNKIGNARTC